MRLVILIALLCLALLPATASAGGWATVGLSSTPDGVGAGDDWDVTLTILQHGRTPLAGVQPAVVVSDAKGAETRFAARESGKPGIYTATVKFPQSGKYTYVVDDGFGNAFPHTYPPVTIGQAATASTGGVAATESSGPPILLIVLGGALVLISAAVSGRRGGARALRGAAWSASRR